MARGFNQVLLAATLTEDPQLRYTPSGLALLDITLAGADQPIPQASLAWYHRVRILGKSAEFYAEHLKAGMAVLASARFDYRTWEAEGVRKSALELKAERLEVLYLEDHQSNLTQDAKGQVRMLDAINQVTVIGNLTKDPQTKQTQTGKTITHFSIAITERSPNKEEKTHYVDIEAWEDLSDLAAKQRKGDPVYVEGRLVSQSWVTPEGEKRTTLRVSANRIERLQKPLPKT